MIRTVQEIAAHLCDARAAAGRLLVGLDFDGTLAPIVPRPEDAALAPGLRRVLEQLAHRDDTRVAVISGRGLDDVAARVTLDGVYYAGNHGLEIRGPDVHRVHEAAAAARESLAALGRDVARRLEDVPGAIIEDKGLTLSVHYRLVDDDEIAQQIRDAVHAAAADIGGLRSSDGKKVIEVRPDVDWHKGRALEFLRDTLEAGTDAMPATFIGDDRTDEDAFRALRDDDIAVFVGDAAPMDTAAGAWLRTTDEVAQLLQRLAA